MTRQGDTQARVYYCLTVKTGMVKAGVAKAGTAKAGVAKAGVVNAGTVALHRRSAPVLPAYSKSDPE